MLKNNDAACPVKPLGRILYNQIYERPWAGSAHADTGYDKLCICKGYSSDKPFSVYVHKDTTDPKPFKVVYEWEDHQNHKTKEVQYYGRAEHVMDHDTYYIHEIIGEHSNSTAAKREMRDFAAKAFAKVNDPATQVGQPVHAVGKVPDAPDHIFRLGDLVTHLGSREGIIWRVVGERRKDAEWLTELEPVYAFMHNHEPRAVEVGMTAMAYHVKPIDIATIAARRAALDTFLQDEARRLSQ